MNKKIVFRSLICVLLAVSIAFGCGAVVFADRSITNSFTPDNAEILEEYANAYGWDMSKMLVKEWSDNGESYRRQVGGQREYLSDCFNGTNDFLMSPAEYDENGNMIFEGNKTYTMDFLEEHEIPLGNSGSGAMIFGAGANSIVAVALGEVGRSDSVESPPHSNNVKYNTWYYGHAVSGQGYSWCVVFIIWCAEQAGCANVFPRVAGTDALGNGMMSKGYRSFPIKSTTPFGGTAYTPVPGDIILFTTSGSVSSSKHVGLIVGVDADGIYVVEGNTTGFGQVPSEGVAKVYYDSALLNSYTPARNALIYHVNYPLTTENDPENTSGDVASYIKGALGINEAALCAVLANISAESGGDPSRTNSDTGAYGLCQWSGARLEAFHAWCQANGRAYDTASAQVLYLAYDLQTNYPNIWNTLRSADNTADGAYRAASSFAYYFDDVRSGAASPTTRAVSARRDLWPQYAPSAN